MIQRAFGVGLAVLLFAGLSSAAPKPSDDPAVVEARKHVDKAKVHYKLGEFEQAIAEFKEAYRVKPAPGLLFNLAQAYRMAGDLKQSRFYYQNYLRDQPNAPNRLEVERQLEQIAAAMAEEDAKTAAPPAKPSSAPPEPAPVVASASTEPSPAPVPVVVEPIAPPEPTTIEAASFAVPEEPKSRVVPLSVGAVSAVLAIAGAVTYGLARSDWSTASGTEHRRAEVDALIASGDGKRVASIGLGAAAVAVGITSAVLFVAF